MLSEILLSAAICAAVIGGVWLLRGMLLTPVSCGENQEITVELRVSGESAGLENTVSGILWLIDNGTLRGDIRIMDSGMDDSTRRTAELLARTNERVSFIECGSRTDL